jgi:hypothetical protein
MIKRFFYIFSTSLFILLSPTRGIRAEVMNDRMEAIERLQKAPPAFTYQASLRDAEGNPLANKAITLRLSIQAGESGVLQWQETQDITTDEFGMLSIHVGRGTRVDGLQSDFSSIPWTTADMYLKVELNQGQGFSDLGSNQLLSVPYAFAADNGLTLDQATKLANIPEGAEANVQGDWNQVDDSADDFIKNKPVIPSDVNELTDADGLLISGSTFSGSFNDLTDVPANLDTDLTDDFSGDYEDLMNKPTIPIDVNELTDVDGLFVTEPAFSGSFDDLTEVPANLDLDDTDDFSGDYEDLANKPVIPADINQLTDADGLLVSEPPFSGSFEDLTDVPANLDVDVTDDFSGDYTDLLNKPTDVTDLTTHSASELSDITDAGSGIVISGVERTKLTGIENGAQVNVQSDWSQSDGELDDFIKNKPTDVTDLSIHTASELSDISDSGSGIIISGDERTKLTGIDAGAQVNVQSDWNQSDVGADSFILNRPTNLSDFVNDLPNELPDQNTYSNGSFLKSDGSSAYWGDITMPDYSGVGTNSFIGGGNYNTVEGNAAATLGGIDLEANSYAEVAIGRLNTSAESTPELVNVAIAGAYGSSSSQDTWNTSDRLFSIGNGSIGSASPDVRASESDPLVSDLLKAKELLISGNDNELVVPLPSVNDTVRTDAMVVLKSGNTTINGSLTLTNGSSGVLPTTSFTFPRFDGQSGQVMKTNGYGTLSWQNAASYAGAGTNSFVGGGSSNNVQGASAATLGGNSLYANSFAEIAIGQLNTNVAGSASSWGSQDRLFSIGNGASVYVGGYYYGYGYGYYSGYWDTRRSDALVVNKDGSTTINGALTLTNGTSGQAPTSSFTFPRVDGVSGQVLQTNGSGQLSWNNITVPNYSGNGSISFMANHYGNYANGGFSTLFGRDNSIDADNASILGGRANRINGYSYYANIGGGQSNTIGYYDSHSVISGGQGNDVNASHTVIGGGKDNTASGFASTVGGGLSNSATGQGSTIPGGRYLSTSSYSATVIGHWNASTNGNSSSRIATDPLFVVGNGDGSASKSDAMVVLRNGNTTVNGQLGASGDVDFDSDANVDGSLTVSGLTIWDRNMPGPTPFTLPSSDGSAGQVLQTDGSGNVTWEDADGASYSGGGTGSFVSSASVAADGEFASAFGRLNSATGNYSNIPGGFGLNTSSYGATVIGHHNSTVGGTIDGQNSSDPLFVIGNGASLSNKNDAMVMLRNGNTDINGSFVANSLGVDGEFTLPTTDGNEPGQVLQTDGGGTVTWETLEIPDYSGSGNYSFVAGYTMFNSATGSMSTVSGGAYNYASSYAATVSGGGFNSASNYNAVVGGGRNNNASGKFSAIPGGLGLNTSSYSATVIGHFNTTTGGTSDSQVSTDALFIVGNGASGSSKSDAFVMTRDGDATLAGTLTQNSDERLKREITELDDNMLTKVNKLEGVKYKWNGLTPRDTSQVNLGLIAQEVEKLFPELVEDAENGYKSVNYIGLIPVLIEAIKELSAENSQLKRDNNLLTSNQEETSRRLATLEDQITNILKLMSVQAPDTGQSSAGKTE